MIRSDREIHMSFILVDCDFVTLLVMKAVCDRLDIEYGDRLSTDSYKRKFLITKLPDVSVSFTFLLVMCLHAILLIVLSFTSMFLFLIRLV